ncbi:MAG: hypothetical protein KDC53_19895 [Saprospiraceae bacterium]|nr:hypothetical protein [Saprospiraceae bacterium]
MENKIFDVGAGFYKSMVLRDSEIWLSQNKVDNLDKFEKAVQKVGMMKSAYALPLSYITGISFNDASVSTKIKYNDEGKEKSLNIGFDSEELSNEFGEYLGQKLGFSRSEVIEGQTKPLLWNLLLVLVTMVSTYILGTLEDTTQLADGGSRRSRSRGAIAKIIIDTIGHTGVIIIGLILTFYFIYKAYRRYSNPALVITYK